jgi:serine/threonine-protein kinase
MLVQALEQSQLAQAIQENRTLTELAYLSPEQASPGQFVDELSDLYGLGAVLYAIVTGRPPFTGDSAAAVLQQIRSPARVTRPTALSADTPPALETVVLKLLAKRQEDRYQTPAELLSDLEPIAEAEEVAV